MRKIMVHFPKFLIMELSFSTTLAMIFLFCIFHHLWYCHFEPSSIFPFVVIIFYAIRLIWKKKLFCKTLLTGFFSIKYCTLGPTYQASCNQKNPDLWTRFFSASKISQYVGKGVFIFLLIFNVCPGF